MMSAGSRRLVLTVHVTCSVGWLGAIAVFLVLAISGLAGGDQLAVRADYLAMDRIGWLAIVPLCFGSLVTGIVQGVGTPWGLVRHYWVLIKLVINVLATAILLLHMRPIGHLARVAAEGSLGDEHRATQIQIIADAGLALVALLAATVLSIYKPRGVIGRRRRSVEIGSTG